MIQVADVESAARRIASKAVRTPLLASDALNERLALRAMFKCENLQRSGSFKFRGAYNLLLQLTEDERKRGAVAISSGNHAQGFAAAARILSMQATVAMPHDAPALKLRNTKRYGAQVVHYDRFKDDEKQVLRNLAEQFNAVAVPPFDHPHIIAGQGTAALEAIEQADALGAGFDTVLIPCGGGGLAAGHATVLRALRPDVNIFVVEPEGFDDTGRSLASGEVHSNAAGSKSICDALLIPRPGELTLPILRAARVRALVVSDDEVRRAVKAAFDLLKLAVEPGGAVALAALLSGRYDFSGREVLVVLSGGNVDHGLMAEILGQPD